MLRTERRKALHPATQTLGVDKMKKFEIVKIIDLLSFISLTLIFSTGVFIKYSLPPRSGGATVWGLNRHEWGDVHFYISISFLLLLSVHLLLHFEFIKNAILGKASREQSYRLAIGMVSILVLLLFLLAPFFSPVENNQGGGNHRHGHTSLMQSYEHQVIRSSH